MLAFVLGGGGSRGAMQAGALEVLIEAGIKPDMLIGTSVGSLNAAFLAHDPTPLGVERIKEIWLGIRDEDIYPGHNGTALWSMIRGRESFYTNANFRQLLQSQLPVKRFGELQVPCYAVATDLKTGDIAVFGDNKEDLLIDGLMSSTALVPVHPSWRVNGHRYVDGAFGAVLPVREAIERGATEIIALNLTTQLMPIEEVKTSFDMLNHTVHLLIRRQAISDLEYARERVHLKPIDLRPPTYVSSTNFSQTTELMELGRTIAKEALPMIGAYSYSI